MKFLKTTLITSFAIALFTPTSSAIADPITNTNIDLRTPRIDRRDIERRIPDIDLYQGGALIREARELRELEAIPPDQRTPAQQRRLQDLTGRQRQRMDSPEAQRVLDDLLQPPSSVFPHDLPSIQNSLQALEQPTALIYPLLLDDWMELVLITPNLPPLNYRVSASRAEINRLTLDFRQALSDPTSDPRPAAQQLYDRLITPLESALKIAGTEVLLYAPDGALRYVPLAALHDGEGWLTERFVVNNITAATLTDLAVAPRTDLPHPGRRPHRRDPHH